MDSPLPKQSLVPIAASTPDLFTPSETARLLELGKAVSNFVETLKAPNTRKAYRADWTEFKAWCARYRRQTMPAWPETVARYLADESLRLKVSTLERRLPTISEAHKAAGHESPTQHAQVRLVWSGIKREKGTAQVHMKPTLTRHLRAMVEKPRWRARTNGRYKISRGTSRSWCFAATSGTVLSSARTRPAK